MLNVLLESRAPRARRMRSTMASAVVHAALIAGAVALTMPRRVAARAPDVAVRAVRYVAVHSQTAAPSGDVKPAPGTPRPPAPVSFVAPDVVSPTIPPIEAGPSFPVDQIGTSGLPTTGPIGAGSSLLGVGSGSVIDEHLVDRAPRLLGRALEPRYPASLRDAGVQGRVVVQFVVDTMGRAELGELQVVESPHALFVDAVRAALAQYRFSVGETGGRKVRTRVQIPFDFTLTR